MSNPSTKLRTRRIIVVDDDEGILDALEIMLDSYGYDVVTSSDGEVLEKLTKDNLPDLILLDVLLSGKDGRELCKLLKMSKNTQKVPILMISADPDAGKGAKGCGADDFIPKPFEIKELLIKVAHYTGEINS